MKKHYIFTLLLINILGGNTLQAQTKSYVSTSGEMIFSFADIRMNNVNYDPNLRWSPVFNVQGIVNHNFSKYFGLFYGMAIRNVGFIYDKNEDTMYKHRTYNFGIPVGIKLGNLNGIFLWGGYEFEVPFHYKEKLFVNEEKVNKKSIWFSDRVNSFTHSVFVGINLPKGINLKFKYYLDNFFNRNYTEGGVKVYNNTEVNIFYVALCVDVFEDVRQAYKFDKTPSQTKASYSLKSRPVYFY